MAVAGAAALAGCGGGDETPTVKSVNLQAFMHNRLRQTGSWTMSGDGTLSGTTGSVKVQVVLSLAPGSASEFPLDGVTYNTSRETVVASGGSLSQTLNSRTFFNDADIVFGTTNGDTGCSKVTMSALPATGAVGSSGALATSQDFTGCTSSLPITTGTSTETWSVENDGGVILVCENDKDAITGSVTGSLCLESDGNGLIGSKARMTVALDGVSVTAKNY